MPALVVDRLEATAPALDAFIVRDVTFRVEAGRVMGLVGESGSGKSTLALALLGYARPGVAITQGSVTIDGTDILGLTGDALRTARGRLVAYIPQDPATALNPVLRLREQLLEGLDRGPQSLDRVREVLAKVGLPNDDAFLRRHPAELSGGQQQRVAIAMAVAPRPRVLVLDEPTTGLDVSTQAKVLDLVAELCTAESMAAVYISHDLAVVGRVAHDVTVLYGGAVVEQGPTAVVLSTPSHPYTRALLRAVPSTSERARLVPIRGHAPGITDRPHGCVYSDRCDFAVEACRQQTPELVLAPTGAQVRCIRTGDVLAQPLERPPVLEVRGDSRTEPLLAVSGLNARHGSVPVLSDVSFSMAAGECLAIVGESGSGKTTLSRCLVGLHADWDGDVVFQGTALAHAANRRGDAERRRIQYVFQNPYASLHPRRDVRRSLLVAAKRFGITGDAAHAAVDGALERVAIAPALADRYPSELSGGQRQRVAIARALIAEPSVLICDEVTSALDVSVQASVVELLRSLLKEGLGMVFVTHNLAVVRSIADEVAVVSRGRIVEHGSVDEVLDHPRHEYTRSLLSDAIDLPVFGTPRGDAA